MYISNLSIRNFRTFRSVRLNFNKGVNTIIGENGAGKTNLFHALRLLIDESLPRGARFFENDFNRTLGNWQGHWIIIQVLFGDLDPNEEAQAIAMHKVGNADDLDTNTGSYALYFRPREPQRRQLYEYSISAKKSDEGLADILKTFSINDYEVVYKGKGNVNFSDDEAYKKYVGDFEEIIFPNPDDEQSDVYGIKLHGLAIPNEVSCTFAKALRDVEADLRSFRDNPLLNLLRGKENDIPEAKKTDIETKVKTLNDDLSSLDEVKKVSDGITNTIKESVGETYAPGIKIQSELPSEIDKLLQSLKLLVGDPDEPDYQGKIWELSLGGANLIYISLKLLEYERIKAFNKIANFILIEEPEAHIHTHIQKTLFQKLDNHNTQVIISTHSTHISSVSQISSVNILSRAKKEAIVFSPSNGLSKPEIVRLERYLDAVRTNLLFAKGVLLVEGDAEQIIIPELVKKVLGVTLDEIGISLINIGSTGFENIARIFHDDRINKYCAIITDLDSSIVTLPDNPADDNRYQKDCRNSQKAGLERKENLKEFCKDNGWIKAFYGKYTFEVDFLLANNSHEIVQVVNKEYSRKADIDTSKALLEDKDVSVSGKEILRLAKKFGKGWFALMIAEQVTHLTSIPTHITKALIFAAPHLSKGTLVSMAKYRLKAFSTLSFTGDKTDYKVLFDEFNKINDTNSALDFYCKKMDSDIVTDVIKKVLASA
ncbi:MAG: DNA replication and repair protein RecF [Bacteroidia bacterium]|nr:DNA replication and repair protein RecF [Bacteroidia bacterium]